MTVPRNASAQKKWILQDLLNPGHMITDGAIWWARQVEALTHEEITFDVYTGGGLGIKGSQALRAVGNRELDAIAAVGAHIAGDLKISEVMELPFLVPCNVDLRKKIVQQIWPYWYRAFGERGAELLGVSQIECRNVYTTDPVESREDLGAMKIRTQGPVETTFSNAIGINAVTVEWTDLYSSLQQGVIDGYWVTNSATVNAKLYEVVDHAWEVKYGGATMFLLVNRDAFNSLSPHNQVVLRQAGQNYADMIWDRVVRDDELYKQILIEDHGMTFRQPSAEERSFMRRKSRPIWNDWVEEAGPRGEAMVERIQSMVSEWREM